MFVELLIIDPEELHQYLETIENPEERRQVANRWQRRQNARLAVEFGFLTVREALFYIEHGFISETLDTD